MCRIDIQLKQRIIEAAQRTMPRWRRARRGKVQASSGRLNRLIALCDQSYSGHDKKAVLYPAHYKRCYKTRYFHLFAATIVVVGCIPHVRADIVLEDEDVDADCGHAHP
ncbi:hypothetical protein [Thiobacillus sp.]